MHGDVSEWVADGYRKSHVDVPSYGAIVGECAAHVVRGGSWNAVPQELRSASRFWHYDGDGSYDIGFRVVRSFGDDIGSAANANLYTVGAIAAIFAGLIALAMIVRRILVGPLTKPDRFVVP